MNYNYKIITNVFIGCCANSFIMEILMSRAPQTANLITFLQFFFIALQGFIFTSKFGTVKPQVPLTQYAILVALFFVTSVLNNYVYVLHVPSTLHMIIRSASCPASMLVSWYVRKRAPKLTNAVGSILITIGVALAMYGGATIADQNTGKFFYWCIGVCILLTTLVSGAYTGLQQEILFSKFGKHPDEMLFYTNILPLPLFVTIFPQLKETSFELSVDIWILIMLNILTQFYCTHSVHSLAARENSLTITFILTLRRFISLIISAIVFKNNLTILHVIGTIIVVFGTYIYFDRFSNKHQKPVSFKDK